MPRLGGAPLGVFVKAIGGGHLPRPALVDAIGAGRPGGVGSRYLLRNSDASEEGGEARPGVACFRHTPPLPPEETPGASEFTRRSPATVGAGLRVVSSG